ncbi:hypothetical protein I79_010233 [Cricetulus griseus]|uniref:Uncharacterized protein n=1 Tax=Cricetulus griseus TaxID=10029 RepID=G3HHX2_CRIGR|nr:hypothetical protein I79_010233 [Cricetulus griseus]
MDLSSLIPRNRVAPAIVKASLKVLDSPPFPTLSLSNFSEVRKWSGFLKVCQAPQPFLPLKGLYQCPSRDSSSPTYI